MPTASAPPLSAMSAPLRSATVKMEPGMVGFGVARSTVVNAGRQVQLEFVDGSQYEVHGSWLKDASPVNRGPDFYRTSATDVWKLRDFVVTQAKPVNSGEQVEVTYEDLSGRSHNDTLESRWLRAFAPYVGKPLNSAASRGATVKGTGSLMEPLLNNRRPWRSDVEMPVYDAAALCASEDLQVEWLERMIDPGIAMFTGVGLPESLEREHAGAPLERVVREIMGKLIQHPVRSTNYAILRKTVESSNQGADYDMGNPLSMHTDHSVYHGTPGFLQLMYQAQGSVRSKVCDGYALVEYMREHHPRAFELLTTVEVTHSSRNTLYTRDGVPRSVYDSTTEPEPFELVHTHPVIQLDDQGRLEKVVQSETKRGVCALPFDIYDEFMEAYGVWAQLCEDARFVKHFDWPEGTIVVTNNHRTLHGRASIPPGMARTMTVGYVTKVFVENRYRLLKQNQTQRATPSLDSRWLTRVPNQVLEHMVSRAVE